MISGDSYQISWTLPHTEARTGRYRVNLYREGDLEQAKSWARVGKKGSSRASAHAEPFYNLIIDHQAVTKPDVPFSMELVAIIVLSLVFFNAQQQVSSPKPP